VTFKKGETPNYLIVKLSGFPLVYCLENSLLGAVLDFEYDLIKLNAEGRSQNKKRRPIVKLPPFLREILEEPGGGVCDLLSTTSR
jgi:hypothetical protein